MPSLRDTAELMQLKALELNVAKAEHEVRKAKAQADLAEFILSKVKAGDVAPNMGHLS